MNNIKDLTDFYMWMVKNEYNHNIRMRVEQKAAIYLKTISPNNTIVCTANKCMHCEAEIKKNEGILLCANCGL